MLIREEHFSILDWMTTAAIKMFSYVLKYVGTTWYKGNLIASSQKSILHNPVPEAVCRDSFLFQHDNTSVYKARAFPGNLTGFAWKHTSPQVHPTFLRLTKVNNFEPDRISATCETLQAGFRVWRNVFCRKMEQWRLCPHLQVFIAKLCYQTEMIYVTP